MVDLTRRVIGGFLLAAGLPALPAWAEDTLPEPTSKPILTVSGHISHPNSSGSAVLDRPTLEGIGSAGFETSTPWYTGPVRFDGVLMTDLMRAVGASGTTVRAIALNDYTTDIPMSDFAQFGVLLAIKRNGNYMPVRDKGPLFIVYPFDRSPELQAHQFYSRSAWQITQLVII